MIVFHIDMDAFFSAFEERERPELDGKPVVVGADPKEGKGRGVVSTCNYEARKFGIRSGMPISKAYRLCPQAVFLPVNFELYWRVSQNIMKIISGYALKMQQAGIDEAFLVPKDVKTYSSAKSIARKIKKEIIEREHLTCSIGIGPNKLVAKIASDLKKPDGLTAVKNKDVKSFLSPLQVRKLYGIGPKTEEALNKLGIMTIGDIAKYDKNKLNDAFGKFGFVMHDYANGIDNSDVIENAESKSVGREITFEKDTNDFKLIGKVIDDISSEIFNTAKNAGYVFRTVVLKIRFEDFETHTKRKSIKNNDITLENLKETADELLSCFQNARKKIRLIGLRLTNLEKVKQ